MNLEPFQGIAAFNFADTTNLLRNVLDNAPATLRGVDDEPDDAPDDREVQEPDEEPEGAAMGRAVRQPPPEEAAQETASGDETEKGGDLRISAVLGGVMGITLKPRGVRHGSEGRGDLGLDHGRIPKERGWSCYARDRPRLRRRGRCGCDLRSASRPGRPEIRRTE